MSVTRKFTIWSLAAKSVGKPEFFVQRTVSSGGLITYEDLGELDYKELTEAEVLTLQENSASARLYRAHLRSFSAYARMLSSFYSRYHGIFKQSDRYRSGNP